jgi:hypothetical protein
VGSTHVMKPKRNVEEFFVEKRNNNEKIEKEKCV